MTNKLKKYNSVRIGKIMTIETNEYFAKTNRKDFIVDNKKCDTINDDFDKFAEKIGRNVKKCDPIWRVYRIVTKENKISTHFQEEVFNHLLNLLTTTYPGDNNLKLIHRYLSKHLIEIITEIIPTYSSRTTHEKYSNISGIKIMLIDSYRTKWGRITLDGKKRYVSELLIPLLVTIVEVGYTGTASAVKFNKPKVNDLIEELIWDGKAYKRNNTSENTFATKIDVAALEDYRDGLTKSVKNNSLVYEINSILHNTSPNGVILQQINPSDSMGCYLRGANLQTLRKDIRHIALTGNFSYDLQASVFAMYAGSVPGEWSAIKNYIQNRTAIRKQVAIDLGVSEEIVKQVFTSIGFGAKLSPTGSIANLLGNKHLVMMFQAHPVVKPIIKEFRKCFNQLKKMAVCDNPKHIFHTLQSKIVSEFIRASGQIPNLIIHDNVYFVKPIDIQEVISNMVLPGFDKSFLYFNEECI